MITIILNFTKMIKIKKLYKLLKLIFCYENVNLIIKNLNLKINKITNYTN